LLTYGIPNMKLDKNDIVMRRVRLMEEEGIKFVCNANVGDNVEPMLLTKDFDAVVLCTGATLPRDLAVDGRQLKGVHFAMDYLTLANRRIEGDRLPEDPDFSATGKHVVIIGGGDTGADCLGTAHRQRALHVAQLEIMERPPEARAADNPWPEYPRVYRVASAHEEGGERIYGVSTKRFIDDGNGHVRAIEIVDVQMKHENGRVSFEEVAGSARELPCDMALLAMGFVHPGREMLDQFGVKITDRGNVWRDGSWMTSVNGVFTAGDMQRGQSLIVWAIAEGRSAAAGIDRFLMGSTDLPAPLP
jgi:glutamate synthase (NADPH/NADH) small chain